MESAPTVLRGDEMEELPPEKKQCTRSEAGRMTNHYMSAAHQIIRDLYGSDVEDKVSSSSESPSTYRVARFWDCVDTNTLEDLLHELLRDMVKAMKATPPSRSPMTLKQWMTEDRFLQEPLGPLYREVYGLVFPQPCRLVSAVDSSPLKQALMFQLRVLYTLDASGSDA